MLLRKFKVNKTLMNITSLGSATFLQAILVFIVEVLTRNMLGPKLFGYWLTVSLIFMFAPIFQLGTQNAMNREVPFYLAREDKKRVQEIREAVFSFIFTIPFLMFLLLLVASIALFFMETKLEYSLGLLLSSFITILMCFCSYAEMYYKSEQNFNKASGLITIKSISQAIFTLLFVYTLGYVGLYIGMVIGLLIELIWAKEIIPRFRGFHGLSKYVKLIKIGFPILTIGLVWSIIISSDRIIISIFMTPEELGYYGVGMLVFGAMMLLPQVLSQVFYPKIVGLVSKNNYAEIKRIYWKVNRLLGLLALIVVIIGYLALPYFIKLFMPQYIMGIEAAQILLLGIYPLTLVGIAANFFNSTNNPKIYLMIQGICILSNIILSLIFLNMHHSITSIALATSISYTIYSILMNIFFWVKIRTISSATFN